MKTLIIFFLLSLSNFSYAQDFACNNQEIRIEETVDATVYEPMAFLSVTNTVMILPSSKKKRNQRLAHKLCQLGIRAIIMKGDEKTSNKKVLTFIAGVPDLYQGRFGISSRQGVMLSEYDGQESISANKKWVDAQVKFFKKHFLK